MTHQKRRKNSGQRAGVLSRLYHAIYPNVPLRGTQRFIFCLLSSIFSSLSSVWAAEVTRPAYTPPPPAVSSGNVAQIIFSLFLVLAAIVLVAWLFKRMNVAQHGSVRLLKVLGAVPIGQRERIVLVEIKDTWLVVGVGQGQIRTLHTLQKMEDFATDLQPTEARLHENKFSSLLSSILNHRKQKTIDK
ncbi:MAG: flagellar biosynthetic protein FliO [Gallionella sp.]